MSALVAPSGECLRARWRPGVVDWAVVCLLPWVQLFVSACNEWQHLALQHHWLLPINCHFDDCKVRLVTFTCKTRYIRIRGFSFSFNVNVDCIAPCREHTSQGALYGTHSQGISKGAQKPWRENGILGEGAASPPPHQLEGRWFSLFWPMEKVSPKQLRRLRPRWEWPASKFLNVGNLLSQSHQCQW